MNKWNAASVRTDISSPLNKTPKYLLGNAKHMPELRRRLIEGDKFKCTAVKNGSISGRVYFRGVAVYVPGIADFNSVHIQCELAPEATDHPIPCASDAAVGDPAKRLAISLTYQSKIDNTPEVIWYTQRGKSNAMKLNLLVDFLDGKDDEYTASQLRLFLDRNKTRGRQSTSYTEESSELSEAA